MLFSLKSINDTTVLSLFRRKAPEKSQVSWLVRPHRGHGRDDGTVPPRGKVSALTGLVAGRARKGNVTQTEACISH